MKKKIALMIFMLLALVMLGCSSDQSGFVENNGNDSEESTDQGTDNSGLGGLVGMVRVPVLFGIAGGPHAEDLVKQGGSTSSLYLINTSDGSATLIGDTGYHLTSIAYCYITNQLYGITSSSNSNINVESNYKNGTSSHSQLIAINPVTGAGTAITELTLDLATAKTVMERSLPASVDYIQETGFGSMTINALGTLVVWTHIYYSYDNNYQDGALFSTVNPLTGVVTPFSFFYGGCYEGSIAFNNLGTLYLMNRYYQPYVNTINMQDGTITYKGAISPYNPYTYYHGDFHPLTGKFWSIDISRTNGYERNLMIADFDSLTQEGMIPTIDFLEAITFGYVDLNTLTLLGLTGFICDLPSNNPE